MASEFGFRPCKIEDLKGQPKVQKMLQIYIKAAQMRKQDCIFIIVMQIIPIICLENIIIMAYRKWAGRTRLSIVRFAVVNSKEI